MISRKLKCSDRLDVEEGDKARYGCNESAIDHDFPRRPPFGKTLRRLTSNGLARGEEAKGLVTPEQKRSWRETTRQNGGRGASKSAGSAELARASDGGRSG